MSSQLTMLTKTTFLKFTKYRKHVETFKTIQKTYWMSPHTRKFVQLKTDPITPHLSKLNEGLPRKWGTVKCPLQRNVFSFYLINAPMSGRVKSHYCQKTYFKQCNYQVLALFLLFSVRLLFCHHCIVCQLLLSHFTDHGMSDVEVNSLADYQETFLTSGDFQRSMPKNLFKEIVYRRILNLKNWEQRWGAKYVVICGWNLKQVVSCQGVNTFYIFVDSIMYFYMIER